MPRFPESLTLLLTLSLAPLVVGCEESRRVPYITPELHDWPASYSGRSGLVLHVFRTGSVELPEAFVLRGGSLTRRRELPVLAYVLEHPKQGLVVWNTGLHRRHVESERPAVESMFDLGTRVDLAEGEDLPSQMRAAGLDPSGVRWVLVANLRFTHAGQIEAFPEARVVVNRAEHRAARSGGPYRAADFDEVQSWKFVELDEAPPLGTMPRALDLFDDGSCMLLDASGPTAGNLALLIRLPGRPVLLAEDLAPTDETLRHAVEPARLFDRDAWWDRIWRLKRFRDLDPKLLVVPQHGLESLRAAGLAEIRIHELAERTPRTALPTARPALLPEVH